MICPKCKERMETDVDKNRYTCKCGKVINWEGAKDETKSQNKNR